MVFLGLIAVARAVVAFPPHPSLTDIPNNTARDLGFYTCQNPGGIDGDGGCQRITDYSGFVYDATRHQMVMFGGGHSTYFRDDVDIFRFDSLVWQREQAPTPCTDMSQANLDEDSNSWISTGHPVSRHTYDMLAIVGDELIMLRRGSVAGYCGGFRTYYPAGRISHYSLSDQTWSWGDQLGGDWGDIASIELDPVSGLVLAVNQYGVWTYDTSTRLITEHQSQSRAMGYANNMVYFPPNDRFYFIQRGSPTEVWEVVPDRSNWANTTVTRIDDATNAPSSSESGWAYDAVNQVIGGGISGGVLAVFDPRTHAWATHAINIDSADATTLDNQAYHAIDYDPVNNVFLFISDSNWHTWAYRYRVGDDVAPGAPTNLQVD